MASRGMLGIAEVWTAQKKEGDALRMLQAEAGKYPARPALHFGGLIPTRASSSLNCLTFGRADGLLSASSSGSGGPAAVRLADGRLMMATDQGLAVIPPHRVEE